MCYCCCFLLIEPLITIGLMPQKFLIGSWNCPTFLHCKLFYIIKIIKPTTCKSTTPYSVIIYNGVLIRSYKHMWSPNKLILFLLQRTHIYMVGLFSCATYYLFLRSMDSSNLSGAVPRDLFGFSQTLTDVYVRVPPLSLKNFAMIDFNLFTLTA